MRRLSSIRFPPTFTHPCQRHDVCAGVGHMRLVTKCTYQHPPSTLFNICISVLNFPHTTLNIWKLSQARRDQRISREFLHVKAREAATHWCEPKTPDQRVRRSASACSKARRLDFLLEQEWRSNSRVDLRRNQHPIPTVSQWQARTVSTSPCSSPSRGPTGMKVGTRIAAGAGAIADDLIC